MSRRWLAVAAVAVASCGSSGSAPAPGPGGGPVTVGVSDEPAPGVRLDLALAADEEATGSACATLDRWSGGRWQATWFWVRSDPAPQPIPEGSDRTCPAFGVALPTRMRVELPPELRSGTWRIAYLAGEDEVGSYVFEVG